MRRSQATENRSRLPKPDAKREYCCVTSHLLPALFARIVACSFGDHLHTRGVLIAEDVPLERMKPGQPPSVARWSYRTARLFSEQDCRSRPVRLRIVYSRGLGPSRGVALMVAIVIITAGWLRRASHRTLIATAADSRCGDSGARDAAKSVRSFDRFAINEGAATRPRSCGNRPV